jgi:hypothetical protein
VDPDSKNPDPDPTFQENPDPDPIRRVLMTKNIRKKNTFLIQNCNLPKSKLQEKPSSLKRVQPALENKNY